MQRLSIYFADLFAGELTLEHGRLQLQYAPSATLALSGRLPVRRVPYAGEECQSLVANLLPEGDWRSFLCQRLALPLADDFGLLAQLGHDCAGAIRFCDSSHEPNSDAYSPLPELELRRWLKDPLARPSPANAPGLRRALAGAQDKLILHVADGTPYLCEGGAPSTVIVKPDIVGTFNGLEFTALNELFCMQLAAAAGLRVPKTFWFAGAFAIERFDRVAEGSRLGRLHQEDFAQLLGVPPQAKYQIGWRECFDTIDRHLTHGEAARRELVERLLFNLFIGNGDAHAKNFALLTRGGVVELAPAYDLLCTQVYPSLSQAFVMKVGSARRQDELSALTWKELATEARLPLEWIRQRGAELSATVQLALRDLASHISTHNPTLATDIYPGRRRVEFWDKLADIVVGNCKRVGRSLLSRP